MITYIYYQQPLSPFSTRRLFSREATFSFVGIAFADVISDADKRKSRFARKKSPSGKRALHPRLIREFGKLGRQRQGKRAFEQ